MAWTPEQQKRLTKELEVIREYFPGFQTRYLGLNVCLEGWMKTNVSNKYFLRMFVPPDMPNSIPEVVILFPEHLIDYHGRRLIDYHHNSNMHLLAPRDNSPNICTFKPTHWNPSLTFYNVLVKVRIWLEAYEGHRISGKPLDYYLKHQL